MTWQLALRRVSDPRRGGYPRGKMQLQANLKSDLLALLPCIVRDAGPMWERPLAGVTVEGRAAGGLLKTGSRKGVGGGGGTIK